MSDVATWSATWAATWAATGGAATSALALAVGVALGTVFFGGLWWTVRRGAMSPSPVRWFLGSLVLRTAVVLGGFYLVGAGQPVRLGLCLLGFVLARALVLRLTRPATAAERSRPCA